MAWGVSGLFLFAACVFGWAYGEVRGIAPLRVVCGLLLIPLVGIVPYSFGHMMGSFNAYIDASGATADFMEAAAGEIEAGHEAHVLEEVERLSGEINATYEGGAFIDTMEAATQRMQHREATVSEEQEEVVEGIDAEEEVE